jgi:hypothetical protein
MAIQIVASVGKKVGQPNFGSKSFNLSCTKEVTDLGNLEAESVKLYQLLEQIVEAQIEKDERDEATEHVAPVNRIKANGVKSNGNGDGWHCSEKQRSLILKLVADHGLEEVAEDMSQEMFGASPRDLNKLQASGLIQRILDEFASKKHSKGKNGNGKYVSGGVR